MIFCVTHEAVCEKSSTSLLILFNILFKKALFQPEAIRCFWEHRKRSMALNGSRSIVCDALRDLVVFVQFKKRKKHPWRSTNFSKVAG